MSDLDRLKQDLLSEVSKAGDEQGLEAVRVSALARKGRISELMKGLGAMSPDERKVQGPALNGLKRQSARRLPGVNPNLYAKALEARLADEQLDATLPVPASALSQGRIHTRQSGV